MSFQSENNEVNEFIHSTSNYLASYVSHIIYLQGFLKKDKYVL
jgi:hypothetical protein